MGLQRTQVNWYVLGFFHCSDNMPKHWPEEESLLQKNKTVGWPEARIVYTVHHIEYWGHLDAGWGTHLFKQRLQVDPPANVLAATFRYKEDTWRSRSWARSSGLDWVHSRGHPGILLRVPRPPREKIKAQWRSVKGCYNLVCPLDNQTLKGDLHLAVNISPITFSHLFESMKWYMIIDIRPIPFSPPLLCELHFGAEAEESSPWCGHGSDRQLSTAHAPDLKI